MEQGRRVRGGPDEVGRHLDGGGKAPRRIDGAALLVDRKSEADPVCLQRTRGGKAGKERPAILQKIG